MVVSCEGGWGCEGLGERGGVMGCGCRLVGLNSGNEIGFSAGEMADKDRFNGGRGSATPYHGELVHHFKSSDPWC